LLQHVEFATNKPEITFTRIISRVSNGTLVITDNLLLPLDITGTTRLRPLESDQPTARRRLSRYLFATLESDSRLL
jgi:predicted O-methyltransferase YrrM